MQTDCGRNGPRNFWQWVTKQPWRKMLPRPFECPGWLSQNDDCHNSSWYHSPSHYLRVNTVLEDPSLTEKYYMGSWHIYLPSEVFFGHTGISLTVRFGFKGMWFDPRFASIYHYDKKLFMERFLGPPGVSYLNIFCKMYIHPITLTLPRRLRSSGSTRRTPSSSGVIQFLGTLPLGNAFTRTVHCSMFLHV